MRKIACMIAATTLLAGCVGYQLGSTLPAGINTVYVPTVVNASKQPLLETDLTSALQSELMTHTSLKLADKLNADSTLEVRITDYSLVSIGFTSDDDDDSSSRSREYRVWMTADTVLRNRKTGEIIAESLNVRGKTTFLIEDENAQGDIVAAKRTSLPDVCSDLAREIADAVTEVWK